MFKKNLNIIVCISFFCNNLLLAYPDSDFPGNLAPVHNPEVQRVILGTIKVCHGIGDNNADQKRLKDDLIGLVGIHDAAERFSFLHVPEDKLAILYEEEPRDGSNYIYCFRIGGGRNPFNAQADASHKVGRLIVEKYNRTQGIDDILKRLKPPDGEDSGRVRTCKAPGAKALDEETKDGGERAYVENQVFTNERIDREMPDAVVQLIRERMAEGQVFEVGRINLKVVQGINGYGFARGEGKDKPEDLIYVYSKFNKETGIWELYITEGFYGKLKENLLLFAEEIDHEWHENVVAAGMNIREGLRHRFAASRAMLFRSGPDSLSAFHSFILDEISNHSPYGYRFLRKILAEEREYPASLRIAREHVEAYEDLFKRKLMDNISGLIKKQMGSVFEFIRANFADKELVGHLEKIILRYAPEYLDGRMDLTNLARRLKDYYSRIIGEGGVNVKMLKLGLDPEEEGADCYGRALFLIIWKGSLKELVWRNSENVRRELAEKGVRCEYLVNVYAGQPMIEILSNIEGNRQINKGLKQKVSYELRYMTGYGLETLAADETLAGIFADEIISVIRSLLPGGLVEGLISAKPDISEDINIAVSSRNIYSLKAGDRAGDCTKVGQSNHWAAGTWESVFENIGIEISYKGRFFGRVVLLAGVDKSNKPVLWAHAIEFSPLAQERKGVFAELPDEKMMDMFTCSLITYACRSGIKKVLLTGISNSSEVPKLLRGLYGKYVQRHFRLVNGMNSGIKTLSSCSGGNAVSSIPMYLQGWGGPTDFEIAATVMAKQEEYVDIGGHRFEKGIVDQLSTAIAGSFRSFFEKYRYGIENLDVDFSEELELFSAAFVARALGVIEKLKKVKGVFDSEVGVFLYPDLWENKIKELQGYIESSGKMDGETEKSLRRFSEEVSKAMGMVRFFRIHGSSKTYGGVGAVCEGLNDIEVKVGWEVKAQTVIRYVLNKGIIGRDLTERLRTIFNTHGYMVYFQGLEEIICRPLIERDRLSSFLGLPQALSSDFTENIEQIVRLLDEYATFDSELTSGSIVDRALKLDTHRNFKKKLRKQLDGFDLGKEEKDVLLNNLPLILDYYREQREMAFSGRASFDSTVDVYEVQTQAEGASAHMQAVGISPGTGHWGFIEKTEVQLSDEEVDGVGRIRDMVKNGRAPDGLERIETISTQRIADRTREEGRDINIVLPDGSIRRFKIMGSDIDYMESKGVPENKFLELLKEGLRTDHIVNGTDFSSIGDGAVISLLDTSRYVGANCKKDGFIGINKLVFELPQRERDIMLQLVFAHEVRHEINQEETADFEHIQLQKDSRLFVRIIGQGFLDVLNNLILLNSLSISPGFISSVYNFAADNDLAGTAKIDRIELSCDISKPVLLTGRNNKRVIIPSYVLRILKEMADLSRRLEIELPAFVYVKNGVATKVFYPGTESEIAIVKIDRDIKGQRGNPAFYFVGSHLIGAVKDFVERKRRGEECRIDISAVAGFAIEVYNAGELNVEDLYFKIFSKSRGGFYMVSFNDLIKYVDCGNEEFFDDILNIKYFGTKWWSEEMYYLLRRVPKEYLKKEGGGELLRIHRHPNGYPSPPSAYPNGIGDIYTGGFMEGALSGLILDDKGRDILFLFFEPDDTRESGYRRMYRGFWEDGQSAFPDLKGIAMEPCVITERDVIRDAARDFATREHLRKVEEAYAVKEGETIDINNEIVIPEEYLIGEGFNLIDMMKAKNRSRDVKIIPLKSAREMAGELKNAEERIVLLKAEDLDAETQKHIKCRVLGFKNYNFLHLASAVGLARAILRDDKESKERFYALLMHRQMTLLEDVRINVPRGVVLLELPPIDENLVEGINSLRDGYARLMMSA